MTVLLPSRRNGPSPRIRWKTSGPLEQTKSRCICRQVLDCASPLALSERAARFNAIVASGAQKRRRPPHSKTLARPRQALTDYGCKTRVKRGKPKNASAAISEREPPERRLWERTNPASWFPQGESRKASLLPTACGSACDARAAVWRTPAIVTRRFGSDPPIETVGLSQQTVAEFKCATSQTGDFQPPPRLQVQGRIRSQHRWRHLRVAVGTHHHDSVNRVVRAKLEGPVLIRLSVCAARAGFARTILRKPVAEANRDRRSRPPQEPQVDRPA